MDISEIRKEYLLRELSRKTLHTDPFVQFRLWLDEAIKAEIPEPTAMALATCSLGGIPSCRMVLLKEIDETGLTFFTNMESRKARDIFENPQVSALFWWRELERQVIVKGKAEVVSREQTGHYFKKRPRKSQLGSLASRQSKVLASRKVLEEEYERLAKEYENEEVPLPPFWGGFKIVVRSFEFWQGRESRLHDRFEYHLEGNKWKIERLSP
jgi:pyridoxamine 5'-phosphate oxidase